MSSDLLCIVVESYRHLTAAGRCREAATCRLLYLCLCVTADTRQNHVSLHDIQTELEEWESCKVCCFWKRHSETEDEVVALSWKRCSASGLAKLGRRALDGTERYSFADEVGDDLRAR